MKKELIYVDIDCDYVYRYNLTVYNYLINTIISYIRCDLKDGSCVLYVDLVILKDDSQDQFLYIRKIKNFTVSRHLLKWLGTENDFRNCLRGFSIGNCYVVEIDCLNIFENIMSFVAHNGNYFRTKYLLI